MVEILDSKESTFERERERERERETDVDSHPRSWVSYLGDNDYYIGSTRETKTSWKKNRITLK